MNGDIVRLAAVCRSILAGTPVDTQVSVNDTSLLRAAAHHRLLPHLRGEPLKEFARQNSAKNLALVAETRALCTLLSAHDVECIVLKGPLLARELYGDFSLRMCDDVDVLVRSDRMQHACDVLTAQGYEPLDDLAAGAARLLHTSHDIAFASQAGTLIELHADIAQKHYSYPLDLQPWFTRARPAAIGDAEVRVLSLEDALVFATVHGAKHLWLQLDMLLDAAALRLRAADFGLVTGQLQQCGAQHGFAVAAALMNELFLLHVPTDETAAKIAARLGRLIHSCSFPSYWTARRLDILMRERAADRVRYVTRLAGKALSKAGIH